MPTCLELMNNIPFSLAPIRQRKIRIRNIVFEDTINCNATIWAEDVVQKIKFQFNIQIWVNFTLISNSSSEIVQIIPFFVLSYATPRSSAIDWFIHQRLIVTIKVSNCYDRPAVNSNSIQSDGNIAHVDIFSFWYFIRIVCWHKASVEHWIKIKLEATNEKSIMRIFHNKLRIRWKSIRFLDDILARPSPWIGKCHMSGTQSHERHAVTWAARSHMSGTQSHERHEVQATWYGK